MNKKTIAVLTLLVSGVTGLFIFWFLSNYRYEEREYKTGLSPIAAHNPFLAAQRYLKKTGTEAESISGRKILVDLPSENHQIFIHNMAGNLPREKEDRLVEWIQHGGSLIITARRLWDHDLEKSGNSLLDRFHIRLQENRHDSDDHTNTQTENERNTKTIIEHKTLLLPGNDIPISVKFIKDRVLDIADIHSFKFVPVIKDSHILQFRAGQGVITVLSDNDFLQNHLIGEKDHALFLSILTGNRSKVWFLYSSNMPALPLILWEKAPHFVICLVLCSLFLLFYMREKSGPQESPGTSKGRNIMEHLEASGHYLYGMDQGKQMIEESRIFIKSYILERFMFLSEKSDQETCTWISERTGLSDSDVHDVLYKTIHEDGNFIRQSSLHQKLMISLQRK